MATGNEYNTLRDLLKAIANAIRSKVGDVGLISAQDFPANIAGIPKAAGNASTSDVLSGVTFSNKNGGEQTGTMTNRTGSSITYNTINSTPVQVADQTFCDVNSDGVHRVSFRTGGIGGYYSENVLVSRPISDFGNAGASNVLSGVSFTSTAGLNVGGAMTNRGA